MIFLGLGVPPVAMGVPPSNHPISTRLAAQVGVSGRGLHLEDAVLASSRRKRQGGVWVEENQGKTMGKLWKMGGKPENQSFPLMFWIRKSAENGGKSGENYGKIMGKLWEN